MDGGDVLSTFVELEKQVQANAVLTRKVADLEQTVADLTAERDLLTELATARDVADYRAWVASPVEPQAYWDELAALRAERERLR